MIKIESPKFEKDIAVIAAVEATIHSHPDSKWNPPDACLIMAYENSAIAVSIYLPVNSDTSIENKITNIVFNKKEIE